MSKEKQQTAVEWLVTELSLKLGYIELSKWDDISNLVQQAKEIEKQQIMNAYIDGAFRTSIYNDKLIDNETIYYLNKYGK